MDKPRILKKVSRRMVFCTNCGHEWISKVVHPACSSCDSRLIVESKDVSPDVSATMIRVEVKNMMKAFEIGHIQSLINGYHHHSDTFDVYEAKIVELQDRIDVLEAKVKVLRP